MDPKPVEMGHEAVDHDRHGDRHKDECPQDRVLARKGGPDGQVQNRQGGEDRDYIVTADDMERMKPDPQSIEMILAHYESVAPDEVVMVGDMKTDVQAGRSAGVHTIGAAYGYGRPEELEAAGPDLVVWSALELLDAVSWPD